MKLIAIVLGWSFLVVACQNTTENSTLIKVTYERNSKSILALLESKENEKVDYNRFYAEDFEIVGTIFGQADPVTYEQMIKIDRAAWAALDFEINPINLLPGVDADTKEPDGSVRYYGEWKVTRPATASNSEKSATLRVYSAYTFNEEGKITQELTYGDFTGLNNYLISK